MSLHGLLPDSYRDAETVKKSEIKINYQLIVSEISLCAFEISGSRNGETQKVPGEDHPMKNIF